MSPVVRGGLLALVLTCGASAADGQLLSPGPLSLVHESLEGLQRCTDCHQLGRRGVAPDRCLECHTPLKTRLEADAGYHATVAGDDCADCHQDHLGRDFGLIRLDTATFDHGDTGYPLTGLHEPVECRSCHESTRVLAADVLAWSGEHGGLERTFLGLGRQCANCHVTEDPHGAAFGAGSCTDCHDTGGWNAPLPFDHGSTDFPLVGEHQETECADCHTGPPRPDGSLVPGGAALVAGGCVDCHETPHGSAMSSSCADCHEPAGWHVLRAGSLGDDFDHGRTGFALRGAHGEAECTSCHRPGRPPRTERLHMSYRPGTAGNSYPLPEASTCASCHVDNHAAPAGGGRWLSCTDCHAEEQWTPSTFGIADHTQASAFPLDGAHVAVPCVACHVDPDAARPFPLALGAPGCEGCHETDELHQVAYADFTCVTCHDTDDFAAVHFGHPPDAAGSCASCHGATDPHDGQFGDVGCAQCHGVETFTIPDFDHSVARFVLDGAHRDVTCSACHVPDPVDGVVRYRPLGTACEDCHGGGA